ncbi:MULTISPECIES: hypothetical protein [unclassified Streptomyces]|nr:MULTISPECIES: hypothetical protein [unclassified Streptomyces]
MQDVVPDPAVHDRPGVEVLAPAELRDRIARTVAEPARTYGNSRPSGGD